MGFRFISFSFSIHGFEEAVKKPFHTDQRRNVPCQVPVSRRDKGPERAKAAKVASPAPATASCLERKCRTIFGYVYYMGIWVYIYIVNSIDGSLYLHVFVHVCSLLDFGQVCPPSFLR